MSSSIRDNTSETLTREPMLEAQEEARVLDQPTHPSITRRKKTGSAPLSFAQERLWFLDQIEPGTPSANLSRALRLKGPLNQDLLRESLAKLVRRHEALRTTFATNQLYAGVDSRPAQLVSNDITAELLVTDLSGARRDERDSRARELAQQAARQAFDLSLGPLLRTLLLVLDQDEYVLVLTAHRIICDDRSLELLLRELLATYGAAVRGDTSELTALPIQLADFADWQRSSLDPDVLKNQSNYWHAYLRGAPAMLELPADRPRPPVQSGHGRTTSVVLDQGLSNEIRRLARSADTSLFVILMTAFQILLSRYCRQTNIVSGAVFSNRDTAETKNLIGPLANAFAVRTDLSDDPGFRELLERVRKDLQAAKAHRLMPFEKLVEEMPLERSMSFAPIFQAALNMRPKVSFANATDLLVERFSFETGIARLDLTLEVSDEDEIVELYFEYDSDLFDPETIAGLASHFEVLLRGIVRNPDERCSELPLLSNHELKRIGQEWNGSQAKQPAASCIDQMFAIAAAKRPAAIAVSCGEERVSYSELNARANQLAHYLRRLGVGAESRVGVYLERSVNNIVTLLGIMKAGGAYLPIDPTYPADRVSFMLADSGVPVLITQQSLAGKPGAQAAAVIQIDDDWPHVASESKENPESLVSPGNLAYVIYTSGSTGHPKGVSVTHQTVTHLFAATREQLGFQEGDVWTTVHSSAFDFSVWEIWGALLQGGRLVIVPLETTQSPRALYELLRAEGVTILNQTPSALRQLLDLDPDLEALSLRTIVCGGDALDQELAERLATIRIPVWNFYGPTESTVWATCAKLAQTSVCDSLAEPGPQSQMNVYACAESQTEVCANSIGRPLRGLSILILDDNLHPLPLGVPGEICIGGAGLARGYLRRPELTAERFVPHPFSESAGERLYRTGDLGRTLRSGQLEFLGRLDNQVKLRGFRIELGEIETVLCQESQIDQAVVIIREDQPGDKRLVAYIVPAAADAIAGEARETQLRQTLRRMLAEKLPEYMMPAAFVFLDALPLTPNRKVDRRSLPRPDFGRRNLESNYVAPRDNFEKQLVNIWVKLLGVETVGVRDNFFELGGHSLLAVRLFAQIENRFGKRQPLAALFQAPTVEQLANLLRENSEATSWSSLVAIQPQGSKPPLYCIHAAGANVLIYRPLSRHLGNDQPVFALQAQGLDGQHSPFLRVEDMAAHYIKELRAFQPEGPYHLLGASFGGLVIFEMAHQLLAQGQKVGLLAMLNTNCPVYPAGKRIRFHLAHLKEHGPRFYAGAVWQTLKRKMGQPTVSVEVNDNPDPELARLVADRRHGDEALVRTVLAILDAEKDYVPRGKIYPGPIDLFWALDADADAEDNRLGWARLTRGGLKIHQVPGTHISIREEPQVAVLAAKLRECLAAAAGSGGDPLPRAF